MSLLLRVSDYKTMYVYMFYSSVLVQIYMVQEPHGKNTNKIEKKEKLNFPK